MVFTVVTFIMLLGGSAYTLDNGMEDSKAYPFIQEQMRQLIHQYQWDVAARRSVDIVQEYVSEGRWTEDWTRLWMRMISGNRQRCSHRDCHE